MAPWGGGLVVILGPVAPGACRVTKPGLGGPALGPGPMRSGIRSHQAAGAWPCALFPRPPCLLLLGRLSFSSGLRRAVSGAWPPLRVFTALQGVWAREVRRKLSFPVSCSQGGCCRAPPRPRPWVRWPGPRIVQESGEERATRPLGWPKTGAQQMPPHLPLNSNHV